MRVKLEIVPIGIMVCACGAMLYTINHLHPDCTPGKDLCEIRMAHLKDGHEREPVPMNTRQAMMATIYTSATLNLGDTGPNFPIVR
jgi:hypothetical protein